MRLHNLPAIICYNNGYVFGLITGLQEQRGIGMNDRWINVKFGGNVVF